MPRTIYWLPRILAIIYIDLIQLMPSFVLVVLTLISWKYEKIDGLFFIVVSLMFAVFFHSFVIAIPAAIVGILFLLSVLL